MRPATYIAYRELFDRFATTEELNCIIKGLNAFTTVLLVARLNAMFRHSVWSQNSRDVVTFQRWFATVFFDEDTKQRLEARFGARDPNHRPVCHPLQLLNIMRLALAIAEGNADARPDISEEHRHRLGTACLMVSDLFVTETEQVKLKRGTLDERREQFMLQMLASLEVSNPTPLRNLLFRSYATYRIVLQKPELLSRIRKECGGLDFEKKFEEVVRTPLMGWLSLIFGVQTLFASRNQEEVINKPEIFLVDRKTILQNPALSPTQVNGFFDMLSMSFEELRSEIKKTRPVDERLDLVPFKSTPLFETAPDNYACIDFSLVTEKLHNGPYFLLSNRLPENERGSVFKAWGFLFESYVNWLLKRLEGLCGTVFHPDTCWEDGNKSFDAVLIKGRVLVVLEFKGGFLRQDARYSNSLTTFMNDLQEKIGVGCRQLARDTAFLFPEKGAGKRLQGVAIPSNTEWVLPVLVVQDLMLRTPFINYFLNQRFQSERAHFPVKGRIDVLPLNVVQITPLESLVEMAEAFHLDVIGVLHRRSRLDRQMEGELQDFISELPEAKLDRCSDTFQHIFNKSREEMSAILFKDGAP